MVVKLVKKIVKLVTRIRTMWESFEQNYVPQSLGAFQILLNGFFPLRGYSPPRTPLAEYLFAQKSLAELRGTPFPPLTESN